MIKTPDGETKREEAVKQPNVVRGAGKQSDDETRSGRRLHP